MIEQFDKAEYMELVKKIRDEQSLSHNELAAELGLSYMAVKRLLDPECKSDIRALTVRKIKALVNKYKNKEGDM